MLNKYIQKAKEGLNQISKTTSSNPNEYIQVDEIYEDAALREIIEDKLAIYFSSRKDAQENNELIVKNLNELTIENIKVSRIIFEPKREIPFAKPLEMYSDKLFYSSYVSKNKFEEVLTKYILDLISLEFKNKIREIIRTELETINLQHNGYLTYDISSENDKEMFLKLKDIDNHVLTNVKVDLSSSLESIKELLNETQKNYISNLKEKIKETYLQEIDRSFDIHRIEFEDNFSYALNGKITLSKDKEDIKKIVKLLTLESLFKDKFPLLTDVLSLIIINDSNTVDITSGTLGLDATEDEIIQLGTFLMEKVQSYHFIKYQQTFDNIPYEPSKVEWLSYEYTRDEVTNTIHIALYDEPSFTIQYENNVRQKTV